jgi:UDP-N-acetyl-D-mannosaminuronic acid dehydrogenase
MERVVVLGLGYIGLPTAAMFAGHGMRVLGVDVNEEVCRTINEGGVHIEEPYLSEIIREQVARGMITCSTDIQPADAFLIAVPTPVNEDKTADLSYVVSAGRTIARVLKTGDLVVLESTVPPRTTLNVLLPVLEESGLKAGQDFHLAHCPERVLPGQIIHELKHNNRVIGGITIESAEKARTLYSTFVVGEMYITDAVTAELCKLMENTFRDVNIALANELARICERLGANVWDVIKYANKHPRVNIHLPGPGVGGHCLAVDPWFVVEAAPDLSRLISLARSTNDSMPSHVYGKVRSLAQSGSKVVILGCTYKPDIDDLRESPILALVNLMKDDYRVHIIDPLIRRYDVDVYEEAKDAELVILGVHHKRFASIDLVRLASVVRKPIILDTRNFFSKSDVENAGFEYHVLGVSDQPLSELRGNEREVAATNE